jgi:hypothetical protein
MMSHSGAFGVPRTENVSGQHPQTSTFGQLQQQTSFVSPANSIGLMNPGFRPASCGTDMMSQSGGFAVPLTETSFGQYPTFGQPQQPTSFRSISPTFGEIQPGFRPAPSGTDMMSYSGAFGVPRTENVSGQHPQTSTFGQPQQQTSFVSPANSIGLMNPGFRPASGGTDMMSRSGGFTVPLTETSFGQHPQTSTFGQPQQQSSFGSTAFSMGQVNSCFGQAPGRVDTTAAISTHVSGLQTENGLGQCKQMSTFEHPQQQKYSGSISPTFGEIQPDFRPASGGADMMSRSGGFAVPRTEISFGKHPQTSTFGQPQQQTSFGSTAVSIGLMNPGFRPAPSGTDMMSHSGGFAVPRTEISFGQHPQTSTFGQPQQQTSFRSTAFFMGQVNPGFGQAPGRVDTTAASSTRVGRQTQHQSDTPLRRSIQNRKKIKNVINKDPMASNKLCNNVNI